METIAGGRYQFECDTNGCRARSEARYNLTDAVRTAEGAGWVRDPVSGRTHCPCCVRNSARSEE